MATYAIGDVQGCARTFEALLERIDFDAARDRLWLVGDLVNRGPASADVLRWARDHERSLVCVLGNHDLHLLARAHGVGRERAKDTVDDVLNAPDRQALLDWLRHRPFLHREGERLLVHAGLLPQWSADAATSLAARAAEALRGPDPERHLARWTERDAADGVDDSSEIDDAVRAFCNLRGCDADGQPLWKFSGPPDQAPPGLIPWHEHPRRRSAADRVVCGHWAAQGLVLRPDLVATDTGCVWGGELTAVRLEDDAVFAHPLLDPIDPRVRRSGPPQG